MYPYVTRMLSMCFLAIGTRMYPHVSVCYSYITRMLPLCISVDPGKRLQTEVKKNHTYYSVIVHNNPFTFLYKEEENRAGHLLAGRKVRA